MIRFINKNEVSEAVSLIKEVFDEYVAEEYSASGVEYFYSIITEDAVRDRIIKGNLIAVCTLSGRIAGYIEISGANHIYLLFVGKDFQRKGIAAGLINKCIDLIKNRNPGINEMTVNSSGFAFPFYKRLGFKKLADYQMKNGITSIPMKLMLD